MSQGIKESGPNIFLITIDALRYDHLGCYGYHRNTSPNIDALAGRGVKFTQAISNGGHTQTSFPAIMASALPPLQHAEGKDILQRSVTLAEVLKKAGYHTAAFHSNPLLSHFHGYDHGFDLFDDSFRQLRPWRARLLVRGIAKSSGGLIAKVADKASLALKPIFTHVLTPPIINAEEITRKSLKWHEAQNGKIFIWLHYMDVHHPYMPENEYLSQFYDQPVSRRRMNILWRKMTRKPAEVSQAEREILINLYDADIKYTDSIIGALLDRLGSQMNNTVVIITADHGDEFGEHGRFGHETLYDGLLRVPLIIAGPGVESGISINRQVGLINLAPTIADIAGISKPRSFYGKNLLYLMGEEEKYVTGTVSTIMHPGLGQRSISYRLPEWKYICTERINDGCLMGEEVYNLVDDPGELRNLHKQDNDEADRFELEARQKIAQFKQLKAEEKTDYEKKRIRAKLGKLGKL